MSRRGYSRDLERHTPVIENSDGTFTPTVAVTGSVVEEIVFADRLDFNNNSDNIILPTGEIMNTDNREDALNLPETDFSKTKEKLVLIRNQHRKEVTLDFWLVPNEFASTQEVVWRKEISVPAATRSLIDSSVEGFEFLDKPFSKMLIAAQYPDPPTIDTEPERALSVVVWGGLR